MHGVGAGTAHLYSGDGKNAPERPPVMLTGAEYFTYQLAGAAGPLHQPLVPGKIDVEIELTLGGGKWGDPRWTINGAVWPNTPKILVRQGDRRLVRFKNSTDMDHPMHLHGHVFYLVEVNGQSLRDPLPKDTTLVPATVAAPPGCSKPLRRPEDGCCIVTMPCIWKAG